MKAMKKLSFNVIVLWCVSVFLMTSCMTGDGGNKQSGQAFGVVRFDMKAMKNVLDVNTYDSFYSSLFANDFDGDCFLVTYEIDYDLPENSYESVLANGYLTVQLTDNPTPVNSKDVSFSTFIPDTTKALTDEVPLIDGINDVAFEYNFYIRGMFFMVSSAEVPTDQKMYWNLAYDPEHLVSEENSQRYYDLYLRSTIRRVGEESKKQTGFINAFNMKYYLEMIVQREKTLGATSTSTFKLRVHYPSAISDTGVLTWKTQDSREIQLGTIVPDSTQ